MRSPDRALALYHQGDEDPEALIGAIEAIAEYDLKQALAITEAETWPYQSDKWEALTAIARVVARDDWQQALDIIQPISDASLRRIALIRIVTALPQDLTPNDTALATTRLMKEVRALRYPEYRLDVYKSLVGSLQAKLFPLPDVTASLIEEIGMGDSGTFLELLPGLIRLICKGNPMMPLKLESELGYVETLLNVP